jgi:hypothetical protein
MTTAHYAEDRSALTWPLLGLGVAVPALLAAGFVAGVVTGLAPLWGITAPLLVLCLLFWGGLALRNWPTGIRITAGDIRVGAVRSARAERRRPTVTHQNWAVFTCPLDGVRGLRVETDPAAIRRILRAPEFFTLSNRWGKPRQMGRCKLGVLSAPFMRAALVIELDGGWAHFPATRPAFFFPNTPGRPFRTRLVPDESLTWVVPTRHPERLWAAVEAAGLGR